MQIKTQLAPVLAGLAGNPASPAAVVVKLARQFPAEVLANPALAPPSSPVGSMAPVCNGRSLEDHRIGLARTDRAPGA